jgi:hypothetical protein
MINKKFVAKNVKKVLSKLDLIIKAVKRQQANVKLHIKKQLVRQKMHKEVKERILARLKKAKRKTAKAVIRKHHNIVHQYLLHHAALEKQYRKIMKDYDSHIKKFYTGKKGLQQKLGKLLRNRLSDRQASELNSFTQKILRKIKR